jgi:hypothetical protein
MNITISDLNYVITYVMLLNNNRIGMILFYYNKHYRLVHVISIRQ